MVTTTVWLTTSMIGFHAWPGAPEAVAYLRTPHRHRFGVRVEVSVRGSDREVEFHLLKREVHDLLPTAFEREADTGEYRFGSMSCEMISGEVFSALSRAGYLITSVTVDEDGECGATVTR